MIESAQSKICSSKMASPLSAMEQSMYGKPSPSLERWLLETRKEGVSLYSSSPAAVEARSESSDMNHRHCITEIAKGL